MSEYRTPFMPRVNTPSEEVQKKICEANGLLIHIYESFIKYGIAKKRRTIHDNDGVFLPRNFGKNYGVIVNRNREIVGSYGKPTAK